MSTTLLRLGLWTVILVLALYVLATTYPDATWSELIPMRMLQQALTLGVIVIIVGTVMRLLGKGAQAVTVKNRCRVCRTPDHRRRHLLPRTSPLHPGRRRREDARHADS